jgi:hypothetical protein
VAPGSGRKFITTMSRPAKSWLASARCTVLPATSVMLPTPASVRLSLPISLIVVVPA